MEQEPTVLIIFAFLLLVIATAEHGERHIMKDFNRPKWGDILLNLLLITLWMALITAATLFILEVMTGSASAQCCGGCVPRHGGYCMPYYYYPVHTAPATKKPAVAKAKTKKPMVTKADKPSVPVVETTAEPVFGVDSDKLPSKEGYRYHKNGNCYELSKETAHTIVGDKLQDDTNKLRVTVIGDDAMQKKVVHDLSAAKDIQAWATVRSYPPNHWALQPGFVAAGAPTIYCQAPDGKVLHRQDDYQGGVDELAGALRKAKLSYDARKDPDLRRPILPVFPVIDANKAASYGLALAAGVGIAHFVRKRKAVAS